MAQFYSNRKRTRKQQATTPVELKQQTVVALNHQGRGVVRTDRGVRFVSGALPNEVIDIQLQGKFDANLMRIQQTASERVVPLCEYYNDCGGCDLQHLDLAAQRRHKQQVVSELLTKFAGIDADTWLEPLASEAWEYRRRVRLATHWDAKRRRLKLGFRAKASKNIVEIRHCAITIPALNALIEPLREQLMQLDLVSMLGHIELLQTNQRLMILRLKALPNEGDRAALQDFAERHSVQVWLACGKANEAPQPLQSSQNLPTYQSLAAELAFQPGDFLQAQENLSQRMVAQAMAWLAPTSDDNILELYAGSGNFSIPMALQGARVTAVEGVPSMVQRLQQNAHDHDVSLAAFHADLEQDWQPHAWARQQFNKVLLDPARAGAPHAIHEIVKRQPQRIVYVSCAPDTLARDAKVLSAASYQLRQAQIIDMFPQTHHIECLTWFEREA